MPPQTQGPGAASPWPSSRSLEHQSAGARILPRPTDVGHVRKFSLALFRRSAICRFAQPAWDPISHSTSQLVTVPVVPVPGHKRCLVPTIANQSQGNRGRRQAGVVKNGHLAHPSCRWVRIADPNAQEITLRNDSKAALHWLAQCFTHEFRMPLAQPPLLPCVSAADAMADGSPRP